MENWTKPYHNGVLLYEPVIPDHVAKILHKIKKRDMETYSEFAKKLNRILEFPYHNAHPLHGEYKNIWETHLRNKLLLYKIDEVSNSVILVDLIDHDEL